MHRFVQRISSRQFKVPLPSRISARSVTVTIPRSEQQQHHHHQQEESSGMPRTTSLDSVQSDSPYHFYQTKVLEEYVRRPVNAGTLRQYIFFGRQMTEERLVQAANWVRNELLVRLAHRIRDFQQLPFFVGTNPHIEFVYRLYWGAFEKLRKHPVIKNLDDNDTFCQVLHDLLDDGQLVVPRLALGVTECASHYDGSHNLDRFVNRMLRSRISRRVLAEQHLALTHAFENGWDLMGEGDGYVGIIFVRCSARDLVSRATQLVHKHAEKVYCKQRKPPRVILDLHQNSPIGHQQPQQDIESSDDIVFAYVPEHLEYILFELLNNAVRYTVNANQDSDQYPPVRITVSASETDMYFRISDQGGGMSQERYAHLWSYQARAPNGDYRHFQNVHKMPTSIIERASQAANLGQVHLGMGLPMSRIYAEYWGGELQVQTMEGYGTDVYVRIPRLGTKAENLGFEDDPSIIPDARPMTTRSTAALQEQHQQGDRHRKRHHHHHQHHHQKQNKYHPSIIQQQSSPYISFSGGAGDGWSKSSMVRS